LSSVDTIKTTPPLTPPSRGGEFFVLMDLRMPHVPILEKRQKISIVPRYNKGFTKPFTDQTQHLIFMFKKKIFGMRAVLDDT
jgi:hypothetical protein